MYFTINNFLALRQLALVVASLVLVHINSIDSMDLCYTLSQLHNLNCPSHLDISTYEWCKTLGITRRPRYIHRSLKRRWIYDCNSLSSIPVIWSHRSKRYHSDDVTLHHVRTLIPLTGDISHSPWCATHVPRRHNCALLNTR